jgi:uncharacterized spore protein YtfJ
MTDTRDAPLGEGVSLIDRAGEQAPKMLEKFFAAAQPGAVFGQPVESGSYTIITAAEVTSGGGFGVGMGCGPAPKSDVKQSPLAEAAAPAGRQSLRGDGFGGVAGPWGDRWRSSPSARTA